MMEKYKWKDLILGDDDRRLWQLETSCWECIDEESTTDYVLPDRSVNWM